MLCEFWGLGRLLSLEMWRRDICLQYFRKNLFYHATQWRHKEYFDAFLFEFITLTYHVSHIGVIELCDTPDKLSVTKSWFSPWTLKRKFGWKLSKYQYFCRDYLFSSLIFAQVEISGFRCGAYEAFALLGWNVAQLVVWSLTFRNNLSAPFSGEAYQYAVPKRW